MSTLTKALTGVLAGSAAAVDFSNYQRPGPNDVRSPCPGLNALANHGILPRDGRGMTLPILYKGLKDGLNMGDDFTTAIGGAGLLSNDLPTDGFFDLNMLDQHNFPIEHDASLSRQDANLGDNSDFNQQIWDMILAAYEGMDKTSIPVASHAMYKRYQDSLARNPKFVYGPREFTFRYGETAIYLSTMGDPVTGVAPLEYVRVLFEEERLPYAEGWRPTKAPTTLPSLAAMVLELFANSPEPLPEGLSVLTEGTVKDVFAGVDPVTNLLVNATCAVTGLLTLSDGCA
ncbi:hypothetical protein MBLNU230_g3535t1 [Neophaeotheca triangularis]